MAKTAKTSTKTSIKTPVRKPSAPKAKAAIKTAKAAPTKKAAPKPVKRAAKPTAKKTPAKPTVLKKAAPKKAAPTKTVQKKVIPAKKPVSAKVSATKPAIKAKTASQKTRATKKVPARKSAAVKAVAAKAAAKKPAAQPSAQKPSAQKPSAQKRTAKRISASGLQAELAKLETRLKRSDTHNRKNIEAVTTLLGALEASTKSSSTTQKARLTRHVNALSTKLDDMGASVRMSVRRELETAAGNGQRDLGAVQTALLRANTRLDAAELTQSEAAAKINRHLADMARTIEARLDQAKAAREAAIAKLSQKVEVVDARLASTEDETAQALLQVGDKVTELSEELDRRRLKTEDKVKTAMRELAEDTKAEMEVYQAGLEGRLGRLEGELEAKVETALSASTQNNAQYDIASVQNQVAGLEHEIDALRQQLSQQMLAASAANASAFAPLPPAVEPPKANNVVGINAAFAPAPMAANPSENPYIGGHAVNAQAEPELDIETTEGGPVEFNPARYAAATQARSAASPIAQQARMDTAQIAAQRAGQISPVALPHPAAPQASVNKIHGATPPPIGGSGQMRSADNFAQETPLDVDLPAPAPLAPYADPAYAENGDMRAERIGGNEKKRPSLPDLFSKLPISGRNLRVAGLMASVAVVGLFAAKTIFGSDPAAPPAPNMDADAPIAVNMEPRRLDSAPSTQITINSDTPTIGAYDEMRAPSMASTQSGTLETAAEAGNAIAQFQLGLSNLERGNTSEAVALVRASANQNMPVAQYQLAKFYESGTGVEADMTMARQLTERAALAGNRIAMHDLALYYTDGRGGVEKDVPTAASWFEKAAERGVVDSQFNLAVLSQSGTGIPQNLEAAYFWYGIAAGQGDQMAKQSQTQIGLNLEPALKSTLDTRVTNFAPKPVNEAANGVFRDLPWSKVKVADQALAKRKAEVKEVQTLLSEIGFQIGRPDGLIGPRTRTAIKDFERSNGLPETGEIGQELIERLEIAAGA